MSISEQKKHSFVSEAVWNRFEQALVRRERARLIKIGRIKFNSKPIVMEKNSGGQWRLPAILKN